MSPTISGTVGGRQRWLCPVAKHCSQLW